MPQPDPSARSFTLISLAAVMVLASAGCAAFANGETALVIVGGALALAALIPLGLLFALLRTGRTETAQYQAAAEQQR